MSSGRGFRGIDNRLIGELLRNPNAARVRHVGRGLVEAGHVAIRPAHLPIFEYIDRDHGSRISYLAKHANITAQAMGELVDTLVAHGYLERIPDPADGRARLVCLTDRGRETYSEAGRLVRELEATWSDYLGDDRFQHLKELLADLCDAIVAEQVLGAGRQ